jgi:outer membrane protein TolC
MNANARQLQALYEYQRTILNAFTEVINRMAKVENYGRSIALKRQQSEALQAAVSSAMQLFQGARAEYGDVLFAQRDLMEVRMALVETKRQQLVAIVMAYQALGGGGVPTNQLQPPAAGNPNAENIPLEQPLRLRPDGEQIPPPPPAPQQPEVLPPVS